MTVTLGDIERAAAAIRGAVVETPCVRSLTLSEITGAEIWLKMENEQYTGSFKDRGALVRMLDLDEGQRRRGVIAMSAGNHAQGVAYHAKRLGIPATIVMPEGTPMVKIRSTELLGARVILHGAGLSEAETFAHELAGREGLTFVHPYDDERIIAGQGTVALEMLAARPDLDMLVVPIGGGGLIAGCATAAKAIRPDIAVVGVEAALYPSMLRAIRGEDAAQGRSASDGPTIAEGIAVKRPGRLTQPIVERLVGHIALVTEAQIERGVQLLIEIEKTVAEGAGAAPLAAVLAEPERYAGRRVGLVISGGNIDSRLLASVLMRGLVREGRLVRLRVEVSDQPGSLAGITRQIADLGANVLEVYHQRWFYDVPIKMAEVDFVLETRDIAHMRKLVDSLTASGTRARLLSSSAQEDDG